jgi:transketolase
MYLGVVKAETVVDEQELRSIARTVRGTVIDLSHGAGTPHLASALSCVDILVAAYWGGLDLEPSKSEDPERDRLILSKGHAAIALYSALAHRGFFPTSLLDTFARNGSPLAEQPSPGCAPGVEAATGSLGHGLSLAAGMALGCRINGTSPRFAAILSDGECNEGSVWEAAMFASANRIENLAVVVDYNKWQATGRSDEVLGLAPLADKWAAFGWQAHEVDGHDVAAVRALLQGFPDGSGKPLAIVAHTVKGKGVSFMEDDNNWHYRIPDDSERVRARQELGLQ